MAPPVCAIVYVPSKLLKVRRVSLIEVEISNIEEYQSRHLFEVLPKAWKKVKSFMMDNLIPLDSKLWYFDGEVVGFSCWDVGPLIIIHTLGYQSRTMVCKSTINAQARIGFKKEIAELFSEALHLAFSNDFVE